MYYAALAVGLIAIGLGNIIIEILIGGHRGPE